MTRIRLQVLSGLRQGEVFESAEDRITIGRDIDNQIRLPDDLVSRHHAVLLRKSGDYYLRDFDSTNGTQVNNKRITETILHNGDVCHIGFVEVRFERLPASPLPDQASQRPG